MDKTDRSVYFRENAKAQTIRQRKNRPMTEFISDIAFTPAVKAEQTRHGSRDAYARMEQKRGWRDSVTDDLAAFIAGRDSFYLATVSTDGQPYIQHRGGAPGFLKVIDDRTLGFADFGGNKQYITTGNLVDNDKAYIFLMDYANRRRIKIWARARVVEDDPALLARLADPGYAVLAHFLFGDPSRCALS